MSEAIMYKEAYHLMKHNVKSYKEQMLERQRRWDLERSRLEGELTAAAHKVRTLEAQSRLKLQAIDALQKRLRDAEAEGGVGQGALKKRRVQKSDPARVTAGDMSGHQEALAALFHRVGGSPQASLSLLSVLQTLLVLGPERQDTWAALEALAVRAVLLPQDATAGESRLRSDHVEVFAALFERVRATPASPRLLSVMQTLLLLGPERDAVWQALEMLAVRAVLLPHDTQSESPERILQRLTSATRAGTVTGAIPVDQAVQTDPSFSAPPGQQPAPGRPPGSASAPPPQPGQPRDVSGDGGASVGDATLCSDNNKHKKTTDGRDAAERKSTAPPPPPPPPAPSRHPPPPPPPPPPGRRRPHGRAVLDDPSKAGRFPSKKMKKLNWTKLVAGRHSEDRSMWGLQDDTPPMELNASSLETLFGMKPQEQKDKRNAGVQRREDKITFICNDKMQNLSILLKQFKCSHEHLVTSIRQGDRTHFDVEVLKELLKLLPQKNEIESLRSYQGDADKLSNVDRFYSALVAVPCYELRIECMLVCQETASMVDMLTPKAKLLEDACQAVRASNLLARFCKFVLDVGNFLNYESHLGNAEGFRINSLLTLNETKSNQSHVTLLHYILEEVELNQPELLALPDNLDICEKAAGVNFKHCQSETSALLKRLKDTANTVSSSVEDVTKQYAIVIEESLQACRALDEKLSGIDQKRRDLAAYLFEDASQLALEDLFQNLKMFRMQLISAMFENKSRKESLEKQKNRKKHTEDSKTRQKPENRKRTKDVVSPQSDGFVRDDLLADIRRGFNLKKARPRCTMERLN